METKQIIFVGYWFFHVMGLLEGVNVESMNGIFSSSVNKTLFSPENGME